MTDVFSGLGKRLAEGLVKQWRSADGEIDKFLRDVGLTGEEHNQALYIFPKPTANIEHTIEELRVATARATDGGASLGLTPIGNQSLLRGQ